MYDGMYLGTYVRTYVRAYGTPFVAKVFGTRVCCYRSISVVNAITAHARVLSRARAYVVVHTRMLLYVRYGMCQNYTLNLYGM